MIWVGWVEVDFPHCAANQKNIYTLLIKQSKGPCKEKTSAIVTSNHLLKMKSYFQQSVPPWVRRVCCLVSHPRHRACHPALLWPQCAVGSDVCPHSAEGLYRLTWNENTESEFLITEFKYKMQQGRSRTDKSYCWSYRERIWDGELLCCLKSNSLSWPIEFTVKISDVLR